MREHSNDPVKSFIKVYMQKFVGIKLANGHDFHQEFADELGITRQEAKTLFHRINYSMDYSVVNSMKSKMG